ncbi:MAG: type IV pilus twitching motility protein PilT [Dehalococcoidia bacterium]|nr:type IV pilus twitching motility protein PilT [Dehalococcoidia bacterium]
MNIVELLRIAEKKRASDLHLIAGVPPLMRIDGDLKQDDELEILSSQDIKNLLTELATERQREIFEEELEVDFAYSLPGGGRGRCNACFQQGSISLAVRLLPERIPTVEDLGLPDICKEVVTRPRGLIIVTGPTGSGKSTTIAAMLNYLNHTFHKYLVTIEDPIEYVHPNIKCAFSQRELAADTHSFVNALKYVLRQDPDVILVGEMRDLETAAAVLTVAETGHLVLSTGHAPSAAQSVERIVDLFPPHERPMAQSRLASTLIGVFCQALVPRIKGGRVAAIEIMLATPAVKNLIREGKPFLITNTIRTSSQLGMRTLDDALVDLYRREIISRESIFAFCQDADEVNKILRMNNIAR